MSLSALEITDVRTKRPVSAEPQAQAQPAPVSEEVLTRARERLGYEPPAVQSAPRATARALPLAELLVEQGCQVFEERSVESHERNVVRDARRRYRRVAARISRFVEVREALSRRPEGFGAVLMRQVGLKMEDEEFPLVLIGGILSGVGALMSFIVAAHGKLSASYGLPLVALFAGLVTLTWTVHLFGLLKRFNRSTAELDDEKEELDRLGRENPELHWQTSSLSKYRSALVPEPVLALALELDEAAGHKGLDGVQFLVRHAEVSRVSSVDKATQDLERRLRDPFLIITRGDERYFIAAWDEKELRVTKKTPGA